MFRRHVSLRESLDKSGGLFGSEFSLPVAIWYWLVGEKIEQYDATAEAEEQKPG